MRSKILLPLLIVLALLVLFPTAALATEETVPPVEAEADASGLSWYVEDDCLYIVGAYAMDDYSASSPAPWASYKDTVMDVYFTDDIRSIGDYAFAGFTQLSYVEIPASVSRIGSNAFAGCTDLYAMSFSSTYSSTIEQAAFSGCSDLQYLNLGGNLSQIHQNAFYGCSSIISVDFPDALTFIGDQAFEGCTGLKTIHIPGSVVALGQRAFAECSGLEYIAFTGSAPTFDKTTFVSDTTSLNLFVSIPGNDDSWTEELIYEDYLRFSYLSFTEDYQVASGGLDSNRVGWILRTDGYLIVYGEGEMPDFGPSFPAPWSVFADKVEVIMVLDGVTTVGAYAFDGCYLANAVQLPEGCTKIGENAFTRCVELLWVYNSELEQSLPDSLVELGDYAFGGCRTLKTLSFGPNLTSIGRAAFNGSGLQTISLPDSLRSVGPYAFWFCQSLTAVSFPDGLLKIEEGAFYECTSLASITFRGSAPQISSDAFGGEFGISGNTLAFYPENDSSWNATTMVGYGRTITWQLLPADCLGVGVCGADLQWVLNKNGTLTISGTGDMYDFDAGLVLGTSDTPFAPWETLKDSITSVVVEEGVASIGKNAFYKCFYLEEVSLPDSLTKISESAFFDCDNVPYFEIGKNVSEIGCYAFQSCDYTSAIWVHQDNAYFASDDRGVLFNKDMTLLIRAPGGMGGFYTIPYGVTVIEDSAFNYCAQLEAVTIPSTVTTLRQFAFSSCNALTSVIIPESVTAIDRCAFWVCSALAEVRFRGDAPAFGEDGVFTNVEAYVYYPEGNATWTEDKRQQYEGTLTWIPEEPETPGFCVPGLNNAKFYTIEEAMAAYDPETQYIKLLKNNSIYTWLEKDLRIDLNSFILNGELDPEGFRIYGIDSATDSYTAESFGVFRCYDSYGQRVAPEQHLKTDKDIYGTTKRYLAVEQEDGWSFHRFYMGVSHSSFSPTGSGIGYKALFAGDEWVKSALDSQAGYGLELSLNTDFADSVCATFTQNSFPTNGTACSKTLLLKNILTTDMSLAEQLENGNRTVYVRTFLTLSDGTRICSGRIGLSMKLLLRAVSNRYDTYTEVQKLSLDSFRRAYPELCEEWNVFN